MRYILFPAFFSLLIFVPLTAQTCLETTIQKGETTYDQGDYHKAREYWQAGKDCPGTDIQKLDHLIWKTRDTDGDGVVNGRDKCPETYGTQSDGCSIIMEGEKPRPPADRDHDGMSDEQDQCPDNSGITALHGCPDRDSDGIADREDQCPDVPGTVSGKGCADPAPQGFVFIPGGTFQMGSETGESDEIPVHAVTLNDFYLSKYEVTVKEYLQFVRETGGNYPEWQEKKSQYNITTGSDDLYKKLGSALTGDQNPIVGVSWNDASDYCKWLSKKTGKAYRLPTEAEWEYAAGGGNPNAATRTEWSGTSIESDLRNYANYAGIEGTDTYSYTAPVGSFLANRLGLYDMSGNVWEWCSDWIGPYPSSAQTNPGGATEETYRVLRGSGWYYSAQYCRAAARASLSPTSRASDLGFRVALSVR